MLRRTWLSILIAGSLAFPAFPDDADTSSLRLRLKGMKSDAGQVVVALYDSQAAFEGDGSPVRSGALGILDGSATWEVEGLPPGEYAVKAFHDVDGSGTLERNGFGAPAEPYGFSNNARGRFGPPGWNKVGFPVEGPEIELAIKLK